MEIALHQVTGISLCLQLACAWGALSIAWRRREAHAWLFTIAFSLMAARRITAVFVVEETASEWMAILDGAVFPLLISSTLLAALVVHYQFLRRKAKWLEDRYRQG